VKKLKSKTPDFSLTESEVNAWAIKWFSKEITGCPGTVQAECLFIS